MNVEITVYPGLRWENWSHQMLKPKPHGRELQTLRLEKTSQGRQPQTSDSNKHYMQRNKPIFSKGSRERYKRE